MIRTLAAVLAVLALAGGGSSDSAAAPATSTSTMPADEQRALSAVTPACSESPDKLDAEAGNAVKYLADRGVYDETVVTMLQHLRDSIPAAAPVMNCAQVLATYVTQRAPGGS